MNQIINESKSFIQEQINTKQNPLLLSYNKISKVYAFTNENIYGYMSKLDFANKGNASLGEMEEQIRANYDIKRNQSSQYGKRKIFKLPSFDQCYSRADRSK